MKAAFLKARRLGSIVVFAGLGALAFSNSPAIAASVEPTAKAEPSARVEPPVVGAFAITVTRKRFDVTKRDYTDVQVVKTETYALEGKTFITKSYDSIPYICETVGKDTKTCFLDIGLDISVDFDKLDTKNGQAVAQVKFNSTDLLGFKPIDSGVGHIWMPSTKGQKNANNVVITKDQPAEFKFGDYDVQVALVSMK